MTVTEYPHPVVPSVQVESTGQTAGRSERIDPNARNRRGNSAGASLFALIAPLFYSFRVLSDCPSEVERSASPNLTPITRQLERGPKTWINTVVIGRLFAQIDFH